MNQTDLIDSIKDKINNYLKDDNIIFVLEENGSCCFSKHSHVYDGTKFLIPISDKLEDFNYENYETEREELINYLINYAKEAKKFFRV